MHLLRVLCTLLFVLAAAAASLEEVALLSKRNAAIVRVAPTRIWDRAQTNAMRLQAGLGPRAPIRRGTGTDTAKRITTSATTNIQFGVRILDAGSGGISGYLRTNGIQYYVTESLDNASPFSATVFVEGITTGVTIRSESIGFPYLAGLMEGGTALLADNAGYAVLGGSLFTTDPGAEPGAPNGGGTSIFMWQYATAIWTYSATTGAVGAAWVNNFGYPAPPITILWDAVSGTVYLTADPAGLAVAYPNTIPVTFEVFPLGA
ncbi:hypothetical protein MIND_01427700 [Mycena indigotica]|uniref:Uncharacterized protein n=1 Tax=Mycena indigotica TaxID=2126181 RepID=A0A8H6RYA4_9AGAR|nr:uncharacterized protein MIND_01427700 [Mycena indigotica]KAF7288611.1 hypothetical protein MIND_01427700 [Mycena indigotica]